MTGAEAMKIVDQYPPKPRKKRISIEEKQEAESPKIASRLSIRSGEIQQQQQQQETRVRERAVARA